jgi:hypothetical protein
MQQKHPHPNVTPFALRLPFRRIAYGTAALALLLGSSFSLQAATTPTRTTLAAAAAESGAGAKLSATVETATGEAIAGGTVDFVLPNGQSLGSAIVGADGTATLSVNTLPAAASTSADGSKSVSVTAEYHAPAGGDAYSDSSSVAVAVPEATTQAPGFTATASPTTVTVTAGDYGTSILTVSSVSGYTGAIEFSCSNLPAQVTCAFNPTQQTLTANGSFTSTLQISTQATSGPQTSLLQPGGKVAGTLALALIVPGAFLLLGLSGRRKKLFRGAPMLGLVLLLTGGTLGLTGCSQRYGYLHHPPETATGTLPGTYTITVAVDGSQGASAIENDIPISLVVQ